MPKTSRERGTVLAETEGMTKGRQVWVSRTQLSERAGALRWSLLVSLGLIPLACGGTVIKDDGAPGHGGAGEGVSPGGIPEGGAGAPQGAASNGGASLGGTAAQGGDALYYPGCDAPVVDPLTHTVRCSNGIVHRPNGASCDFAAAGAPSSADGGATGDDGVSGSSCLSDADCSSLRLGYCDFLNDGYGGSAEIGVCTAGCRTDSDCGTGICLCQAVGPGRCADAGCQVDSDCGPRSLCAASRPTCGPDRFECFSPADECKVNDDCDIGSCASEAGKRYCDDLPCGTGRPFLVADVARMAAVEPRSDWLDAPQLPDLAGLSPLTRAELAAHWSRLGQMEHASIAAFARFNLQLLSLGAPADLIEACNRALAEETEHTRTCFAFASRYAGAELGPGKLEVRDCFEASDLRSITKLVLREGCLGEAVAALEALQAAALTHDRAVKGALLGIACDEQSHAELAFKFLRWALAQSSAQFQAELACDAEACLADYEAAAHAQRTVTSDRALEAHGVLGSEARRAVHLGALREVVRPLLAALLPAAGSRTN